MFLEIKKLPSQFLEICQRISIVQITRSFLRNLGGVELEGYLLKLLSHILKIALKELIKKLW